MTCTYRLTSGLLLLYTSFGMLHHPDKEAYSGTQTEDMTFKWLFWRLWAAGSWYFLPAATVWVRFLRVVWWERWVGVHVYCVCVCVCVCVSVCFCLLPASLCAPVCVFLFSMLDECEEMRTRRLQRGPVLIMASPALWMLCPTALCSSTNLTSPPLPLIHTQLRNLLRWSADTPRSVVHTTPLVCIVYIVTLAPDQAKLLAGSYFLSGLLFSTSDSYLVETWWGIQCGRD